MRRQRRPEGSAMWPPGVLVHDSEEANIPYGESFTSMTLQFLERPAAHVSYCIASGVNHKWYRRAFFVKRLCFYMALYICSEKITVTHEFKRRLCWGLTLHDNSQDALYKGSAAILQTIRTMLCWPDTTCAKVSNISD